MGLLDNLNDAAIKKETLDNLPINPTQITIDKILSPTEAIVSNNKVILAGETRGPKIEKDELILKIRDCIKDIGYDQKGFSWKTANIETFLHELSLIHI